MTKFLQDLINKGKVAAFVGNILVETETEERHDEIVNIEEVEGKQLVCQAREMYMESKENQICKGGDRTQWNRNGGRKDGCHDLAKQLSYFLFSFLLFS